MGLLKALVFFLTTLIAFAIGLLGYGLIKQSENPNWRLFGAPKNIGSTKQESSESHLSKGQPPTILPWGESNLNLSPNCYISDSQADGLWLFLTIHPIGQCHRVVIIDLNTGRVLGSIIPSP